jgi:hypothetical protein
MRRNSMAIHIHLIHRSHHNHRVMPGIGREVLAGLITPSITAVDNFAETTIVTCGYISKPLQACADTDNPEIKRPHLKGWRYRYGGRGHEYWSSLASYTRSEIPQPPWRSNCRVSLQSTPQVKNSSGMAPRF